jgi:hypothetical protein
MKLILALLTICLLTACNPSYTKKEQLILKVDPVLMVKPQPLTKLKQNEN